MQEILQIFGIKAPVLAEKKLSGGRIHGTYRIRTAAGDYIAQKLHPTAFPDAEQLMRKLVSVTKFLCSRGCVTLHFYQTPDGAYLHQGWRLMDCIPGVTKSNPDVSAIRAAGWAFGAFQAKLAEFMPELPEPPFHDPARHFAMLEQAVASDPCGNFKAAQEVFDRLMHLQKSVCALQNAGLPVRIIHNDTKLGNLLFDPQTDKPLAVIDLDTVGMGLAAYDFGDAVRSLHGAASELNPSLAQTVLDGFLESASHLTEAERQSLPLGITAITAELAARYLTDFLTGNCYFHHPDSLGRAAQLTALARSADLWYNKNTTMNVY